MHAGKQTNREERCQVDGRSRDVGLLTLTGHAPPYPGAYFIDHFATVSLSTTTPDVNQPIFRQNHCDPEGSGDGIEHYWGC